MDHINLLGSEDVQRAGSTMREAASRMLTAAAQIEIAFDRHRMFLDEWLARFEEILNKTKGE